LTADGRRAVSGSEDRTLKVWDLETGEIVTTFTGESDVSAVAIAADDRTIVAGEWSGRVHFLRLEGLPGPNAPCRGGIRALAARFLRWLRS